MKKIFKLNILLLSIITLVRCDNAVDIQQVGRLTPDATFVSVQDLQDGLIGVYAQYDLTPEIAFAAEYTDEVAEGFASGGQGRNNGFLYNLNPASAASQVFWLNGYIELNRVNRLIDGSKFVTPADAAEQTQFNNVLGQAYALRAFSHFQLLSYYSTDYTDNSALGVIKLDFVPTIDQKLLRSTNGEVFTLIEEDLNRAQNLLSTQSNPTFVSKDFVTALKARMYAYRGDYTRAAPLAQQLLNSYPLANPADYRAIFSDAGNSEVIFKFDRVPNDAYDGQGTTGSVFAGGKAGNIFAFVNATQGGGAYYEFSRSLFNLFNQNDIRFAVSVAPTSVISPNYQTTANYREDDKLIIQKYPGSSGEDLLNDLKVFRSSEMQLILAEAAADAGNLSGVATAIKALRDARFGTAQPLPSYASAQQAWAAILNERRVEFAFEGHRWKDLKRLGAKANQGAQRDPLDCSTFNMTCDLPVTDHRFTLPIPIVEFQGNPGLRAQQNPGY